MPSNLRTYVQWKNQAVFAGEEIECIITFKNIARAANERDHAVAQSKERSRLDPVHERQRITLGSPPLPKTPLPRQASSNAVTTPPHARGHKHSISLGVEPSTTPTSQLSTPARPKAHGRSLSILSIGTGGASPVALRGNGMLSPHLRGHRGKSASVQITRGQSSPDLSAKSHPNSPTLRGTLANGADDADVKASRRKSMPLFDGAAKYSPRGNRSRSGTNSGLGLSGVYMPDLDEVDSRIAPANGKQPEGPLRKQSQISSPLSPDAPRDQLSPAKASAKQSQDNHDGHGTSRNSSDVYNMSNASDETINSELPLQQRQAPRPSLLQRMSQRKSSQTLDRPEHLMMGYVQTKGSFTVDGALVDQAQFEDVKRKGVVSSQGGGGVVGVERQHRNSGFLGGFSWGSIGESINDLFGADDMSSLRDMKNVANMREVPLLSTPQSILFVDLHMAPGESQSFTYRFEIPRGLPPSHKGRAIKVSYNLRIAVQRPGAVESRNMTSVEIPFVVLGSVNRDGDVLGHDLMSPYILLQDTSKTGLLPNAMTAARYFASDPPKKPRGSNTSSLDAFLRYTQQLLDEQDAGQPLASPRTPTADRRFSADVLHARTMQERIDMAILRSNNKPAAQGDAAAPSTNRFTITRSGQHVGVLTIPRAAYRLGEWVHVKLDFSGSKEDQEHMDHTYTVTVNLETLENIDTTLALRGPASVARATRKIYAAETQTVLFARQAGVALEIPAQATPTFDTSGVQLQWRLRVEFTTSVSAAPPRHSLDEVEEGTGDEDSEFIHEEDKPEKATPEKLEVGLSADSLLELLSQDDRGQVLVARERLPADTWEVTVPLRVYGQTAGNTGGSGTVSEVLEI